MKQYYSLFLVIFILAFLNCNAQTEFKKDSIHQFQWNTTIGDWQHNTREYLTYDNGGVKETNLRRQFLSGSNWVNFYHFNKNYTDSNLLEENTQQNWNDPNSGWNNKYKHVYVFDSDENEIAHQYSLYYNGAWQNYQRQIKSYINNHLDIKTMEQYDATLMEFVPKEQFQYYYVDDLLDYEITRIYFPDVATWENDEKIEYTYNTNSQLTSIEYFGYNSTTGMFSESPYKKTVNTYTAEGFIQESITQLWATSQYINTERFAYSYTNGNLTELLLQNWTSLENDWVNYYRHIKTYDGNDNEIEFIYENWNTDVTPNTWKGFLRIVNFWSPSETLGVDDHNKNTSIIVYPNPATDHLNINSMQTVYAIKIYDLLGKQVLETKETEQINISNLNAGVFFLKLISDHKSTTKKILIK